MRTSGIRRELDPRGVAEAMRRCWTRPLATVGSPVRLDPVFEDRKGCDPKPARPSMPCGRWARPRWTHRPGGRSLAANRASPGASISDLRSKRRMAFSFRCCAGGQDPVARNVAPITNWSNSPDSAASQRTPGGIGRDRNQFRHLRSRVGNTDPAARSNARARSRRRAHRARVGSSKTELRSGNTNRSSRSASITACSMAARQVACSPGSRYCCRRRQRCRRFRDFGIPGFREFRNPKG